MYHKVKSYIEEHHMINHGDVVLAGVSGGGDSMAMLDMLRKYSQEVPFSLCAVHVHHGIRGEEAREGKCPGWGKLECGSGVCPV